MNEYKFYNGNLEHRHIMEQHLNRKLSSKEQIHHIDFDKFNNDINNLHLCSSPSEHATIGHSITKISYLFLNKYIWFDRQTKKYTTNKINDLLYEEPEIIFPETVKINIRNNREKTGTYPTYSTNYKRFPYWKLVMECFLKRELVRGEQIHHIDGDEYNNSINNLCLITHKEHCNAHGSLYKCGAELFKRGIIVFENGWYMSNKKTESKQRKERPCEKYKLDSNLPENKNEICQDCGYKILYHKHKFPLKERKIHKNHPEYSKNNRYTYYCINCNTKTDRMINSKKRSCRNCGNKDFKLFQNHINSFMFSHILQTQ